MKVRLLLPLWAAFTTRSLSSAKNGCSTAAHPCRLPLSNWDAVESPATNKCAAGLDSEGSAPHVPCNTAMAHSAPARNAEGIFMPAVDQEPRPKTIGEREALEKWGGRWDSNPRQPRSQPGALPTELRPPLNKLFRQMARPAGVEPATTGLEGRCSIQLSYGRTAERRLPDSHLVIIGWSGQQDSNLRPSAPKADALPDCAMPRCRCHPSGVSRQMGPADGARIIPEPPVPRSISVPWSI